MGEDVHLASLIDIFMAADKTAAGVGVWQAHDFTVEQRISWPLLVGGESSGYELQVCYHVGRKPLHFSIGVYSPKVIRRMDYDETGGHTNPLGGPNGTPLTVEGSHVHRWTDNRHLCTATSLPVRLRFAVALPSNLKSFENAFRWACGELKIQTPDVPSLPKPTRLAV